MGRDKGRVRVTVDLEKVAARLSGRVVSVQNLASMLGIDTRTAGKVLSRMEKMGLARKTSKRTYIVFGH